MAGPAATPKALVGVDFQQARHAHVFRQQSISATFETAPQIVADLAGPRLLVENLGDSVIVNLSSAITKRTSSG
jgi:hypothetical protein